LLARHGEQAEGIGVAQVGLGGEGKLRQVGEAGQVLRPHPGALELAPQRRDVMPGAVQGGFQSLELKGGELGSAAALDRVENLTHFSSLPHKNGFPSRLIPVKRGACHGPLNDTKLFK
jgi:hypothetical protein